MPTMPEKDVRAYANAAVTEGGCPECWLRLRPLTEDEEALMRGAAAAPPPLYGSPDGMGACDSCGYLWITGGEAGRAWYIAAPVDPDRRVPPPSLSKAAQSDPSGATITISYADGSQHDRSIPPRA